MDKILGLRIVLLKIIAHMKQLIESGETREMSVIKSFTELSDDLREMFYQGVEVFEARSYALSPEKTEKFFHEVITGSNGQISDEEEVTKLIDQVSRLCQQQTPQRQKHLKSTPRPSW